MEKIKIYIAGHNGMVGKAIMRRVSTMSCYEVVTREKKELNLLNQADVEGFFKSEQPQIVVFCAAKVGGIAANISNPTGFLLENIEMQGNVIMASLRNSVKKFVFFGSSCIYPKGCPQPIPESFLLSGKLEPTNEGYALAKIVGIKLLEYLKKEKGFNSITLLPCNLYGPGDSFHPFRSHVLAALVKKFVDAQNLSSPEVINWGTGVARREFLHVDDLAEFLITLMMRVDHLPPTNIGSGEDIQIMDLSKKIAAKVGFKGTVRWDTEKPDGMLAKCLDITRIKSMGFLPRISLDAGIEQMISIYRREKL